MKYLIKIIQFFNKHELEKLRAQCLCAKLKALRQMDMTNAKEFFEGQAAAYQEMFMYFDREIRKLEEKERRKK